MCIRDSTAAAAKTVAGFTAQSFQQKNIAGDGSTVVDIYYNRNSYGVRDVYKRQGGACREQRRAPGK